MFESKFWRVLAFCFVALTFINTLLAVIGYIDRRQIRALVESRQKIGLVLIRAAERENELTAEDKRRICESWIDAGYSTTGEQCPQ